MLSQLFHFEEPFKVENYPENPLKPLKIDTFSFQTHQSLWNSSLIKRYFEFNLISVHLIIEYIKHNQSQSFLKNIELSEVYLTGTRGFVSTLVGKQ